MKEIALVHDDQEDPGARRHFLEDAGYRVTLLRSGEELARLLEERRPALVLLDVLVHGKNGFEVCRDLRARLSPEELPVVLCTELYRARNFRDEAAAVGAQAYLVRPIRLDELVDLVKRLTSGRAAADAA